MRSELDGMLQHFAHLVFGMEVNQIKAHYEWSVSDNIKTFFCPKTIPIRQLWAWSSSFSKVECVAELKEIYSIT